MEAKTYEEALARAGAGEEISPRRLAWLKRLDEKHARHADDEKQAALAIEQAREQYRKSVEERIASVREQVDSTRAELEQARTRHAETLEQVKTAQAEHDKAREEVRDTFVRLKRLAKSVWGRNDPPKDEHGNPTVDLCVQGEEVVVDGELISQLSDRPVSW